MYILKGESIYFLTIVIKKGFGERKNQTLL